MRKRLKVINFQLEELGITHIKNRAVILRNISNHENTESLKTLSKIYEPVKVYSRNKGGTEYKTFSPFTLFADACSADAEDAVSFNNEVDVFLKNKNENNLSQIQRYLKNWATNYTDFKEITPNPIVNSLEPLSKNISLISELLYASLKNKTITEKELAKLTSISKQLKEPCQDVELAILDSLNELINFCSSNFLTKTK
jgi:hexosaminidase